MPIFKLLNLYVFLILSSVCMAEDEEQFDASGDYITDCKYATCVGIAGSEWSENHPFGVAVSVRMGSQPAVTDAQIKMVLTRDFKHYGIDHIKFFYEQNDTPATGMALHVRGGTEGPFLISNVRQEVEQIAKRAKNKNPAMIDNSMALENSE